MLAASKFCLWFFMLVLKTSAENEQASLQVREYNLLGSRPQMWFFGDSITVDP